MIAIAANGLDKYYGSNHVLKGISFEIYEGEKVGLLGKNGSGKTTLFKVVTGEEGYERGALSKASGYRVEMLAQIPAFEESDTVEDILRASFRELADISDSMTKLGGESDPSALAEYGRLMEEYERLGGYETEVKLDKVCAGMRIDEGMRASLFSLLSGGEKTRVNLARILMRECDILLLDEPTNHLDLRSLEWLEVFLRDFAGTVVVISHDRVFLDRVIDRVIEIEAGKANFYSGNYSFYVKEKEQRFLTQAERYEKQRKEIRRIEAAAKRLHEWAKQADNESLHKRAFAMEKRIEHMEKVEKPITARSLSAGFDSGGYASKEIVAFMGVSKRYGEKVILDQANLSVTRRDAVALVGENGCGKTTLLKMLLDEENADSGEIKVSVNVKPAYMPQIITFDDREATVLDTLRYGAELTVEKARSVLASFHFMAGDIMKKVGNLSGGEKSRLWLCLMMQRNTNFLILDEPTNHLDIASREWIESVLADFDGTLLFVSHDRYFLQKFTTKLWHMRDGVITQYDHGFTQYQESLRPSGEETVRRKTRPKKWEKAPSAPPVASASIEARIAGAEAALASIETQIAEAAARSDFSNMKLLCENKKLLEAEISSLYDAWIQQE